MSFFPSSVSRSGTLEQFGLDVTVSVSDGTNTSTQNVTVDINNLNDNTPNISSSSSFSIDENETAIGTVTATDADGDSLTYSISGSEININSSTGVMTFASAPDYETKSSYSATVSVSDGGNSVNQNITVNINNLNDNAPSFTSNATFTADENQTSIGTVTATDPEGDSITYAISGSEINIDSSSGVLTFASAPDYETKSSYSATVTASDGTNSATQTITVNINNLNDNSPQFTSSTTFNADENQSGFNIGTIVATDADGDTITFSIPNNSSQTGWIEDNGYFNINSSSGSLDFVNWTTLNYENKNTYTFNVIASDGTNSSIQAFTLNVNDINDTPVITSGSQISINENQTSIITVTAQDEDGDSLTFSISGDDAASMNINSSSGVLELNSPADFETKSSYSVSVLVTDGQASKSNNLSITIIDVNESNPTFTSSDTFSVDENSSFVGTVEVDDSSDNQTITFSVSSSTASLVIDSSGNLNFSSGREPDYETRSSHSAQVSASDGFVTSTQEITISINNLNDNAPTFTPWCSSLYADENQTAIINCVTGDSSIEATDADGDAITFSMTSNEGLTISSSGVVSFSSPPDFETDWLRSGVVSITDGVFVTNSNINVTLNNLNDNAPTFDSETQIFQKNERHWNSGCTLTCPEVGTVTATDADYDSGFNGGEGFEFSYSIISQNPANAFEINAATGAITSLDPHLDYETDSSYELTVQASDGELSDTLDVTVNVFDIDESPYISSSKNLSINENETVVATITADDYEGYSSGNPISIHIMTSGGSPTGECQSGLAPDCEFFSIETLSENTARLSMTAPNYEVPQDSNEDNVYELSIGLSMGNPNCGYHYPSCGQDFDFTVTVNDVINATDVNENPSFTSSSTFNREENHAGNGSKYCCTVTVSHPQNSPTYLSLSGTDSDKMYIQGNDPTSGNHGRIIFNELIDFESDQLTYSVIVTAYDDNSNSSQQAITINITDHVGDDGS